MSDDDREGYYADPNALPLPTYIVPGHGFLVLRDLHCDALHLDGLDVGDPKATPHPHFTGGFRGYFNVPPGHHHLVVELGACRYECRLDLAPGDAQVRRLDTGRGLVPDDPATEQHYRDLARSGSMLQAGALRPWPLASVFFEGAPDNVVIDGRVVPSRAPRRFFGVTNLLPGEHRIRVGNTEAIFTLPIDCRALIDCSRGVIAPREPRLATSMIRLGMLRATRSALLTMSDLAPPAHHEAAANANIAALEAALGRAAEPPPRFGSADLARLDERFTALRRDFGDATLTAYVDVLRRCYIVDREMAKQPDFFAFYAAALLRQIELLPRLKHSPAMTYLRYLAEDLGDTGVPALAELGRRLGAALR